MGYAPVGVFHAHRCPVVVSAVAEALGEQKARAVIASGAETVVSGNIGCLTQLEAHLKRLGSPIQVRHTLQLLRDALVPPT